MDKNFMVVLHEEEMLDDTSLDCLKGGDCHDHCTCHEGSTYCSEDIVHP